MISYPEYQQKAQEELDRVVGHSRLPSFADFKHLPYIRAIVKEVCLLMNQWLIPSLIRSSLGIAMETSITTCSPSYFN